MYMTTGEIIRRIRRSLGMTQAEMGALINFSQPAVSGLENGGPASHDVRVLRLVARALKVPLAILVVESDEEADVDRRNFFRAGALGGVGATMVAAHPDKASMDGIKVSAADVADINESVKQIHELDLVVGGDRLCNLATGQVRYVRQLLDAGSFSNRVGEALATATAETMTAAGWVHYDADRREDARRFYADAVQTANEAGDGVSIAHALMNSSALDLDTTSMVAETGSARRSRPQRAAHLAQAAQDAARRKGGPKVRALAALREAQAQGAIDKKAMGQAIGRAYRAYESGRGFDPDWAWLPESELNALIGISHMFAGEYKQAERHLSTAVDSAASWPREQVAWQLYLAHSYLAAGEPAQACGLLNDNAVTIESVSSTRMQRELDAIATAVRPHNTIPEVKMFLTPRSRRA
ncbi:helix-turn-helix domain-containing protein [Nocardia testacea]|uniref:helix-turn-helix domain-containing protein n=1 Tax=Nocardia testacea TaxID=248551 RepID=UPI003A8C306F